MKRVVKIIGLLGGALALVWAMRERFISVAISREPDVPQFRFTPPDPQAAAVEAIEGIGPVFAERLRDAGIADVGALAASSVDKIARAAQVGDGRAGSWIDQARAIT